jgi:hypothetical protein
MVTANGNAASGYTYNAGLPDLPRSVAGLGKPHRPWCGDCKRKDLDLDAQGLCERCARAAVTRAEQKARWAELERQEAAQRRSSGEDGQETRKRRTRRGPKPAARKTAVPSRIVPELGVSALAVKTWAVTTGRLDAVRHGRVPKHIVAAYADAQARGEVA